MYSVVLWFIVCIMLIPVHSRGPGPGMGEWLSFKPRVKRWENWLSSKELDHWLNVTRTLPFGRTAIVGIDYNFVDDNVVTSRIHRLPSDYIYVSRVIDLHERIAQTTGIPTDRHEQLSVLSYKPGEFFRGHLDKHALPNKTTSTRTATFFITLNDVQPECGGSTFFPMAEPIAQPQNIDTECNQYISHASHSDSFWTNEEYVNRTDMDRTGKYIDGFDLPNVSSIKNKGLWVQPMAGSALVWHSELPNGAIDPQSQHLGCPLRCGTKHALVVWMH